MEHLTSPGVDVTGTEEATRCGVEGRGWKKAQIRERFALITDDRGIGGSCGGGGRRGCWERGSEERGYGMSRMGEENLENQKRDRVNRREGVTVEHRECLERTLKGGYRHRMGRCYETNALNEYQKGRFFVLHVGF